MNKKKTASGLKCLAGEVRRKKEEVKEAWEGCGPRWVLKQDLYAAEHCLSAGQRTVMSD